MIYERDDLREGGRSMINAQCPASTEPARAAALSGWVLTALVLCGPVLTVTFWASMVFLAEGRPYWKSDLVNGIAGTCMAIVLLGLALAVVVRRRRGARAVYVGWGSAATLVLAGIYCAFWGVAFLLSRGESCQEYCWYELGQVVWWVLCLFTWVMAAVLALVGLVRRGISSGW